MKLIKCDGHQRSEPQESAPSLVASVRRLADRLGAGATDTETLDAAECALAQARDAERRIAEQIERLAHFEQLALTDGLTGLLNRRGFESEIKRAMTAARRYREKGVLIFVDLDGFKPINDTFGHAAGDEVLVRVAALLTASVRATDSVARLGGDEFAVLLTRTGWDSGLKRAEAFDKMINRAVVNWRGRVIAVRASFGFQTYGPNDDMEKILQSADDAMYATKRARAGAEPQPRLSHASA